jgi:hypothetical protein
MISKLLNNFLINKVNPKSNILEQASDSQNKLKEILANKLEQDPNLPSVLDGHEFLFGSAVRGTKQVPFDDIDLMLVLDGSKLVANESSMQVGTAFGSGKTYNPLTLPKYLDESGFISSQKILNTIRSLVDETYSRSKIRKDGQAINLWMDSYGFGIDIVPAFKIQHNTAGVHYYIPKGTGSHMWQSTNPHIDLNLFDTEDNRLSGLLKPTARLLRKWNELSNDSRLSGFHIDALVYHSLSNKTVNNLENAVKECFKNFENLLSQYCPQFSGFGSHIDHKLTNENRKKSKEKIKIANTSILGSGLGKLLGKDNSVEIWHKIFDNKLYE